MSRTVETSKTRQEQLDLVFRALGDRTRREILANLADGPGTVGDIAEPFKMSLPAVGKHLRVLERAGLIHRHIDGRIHRCSLSAEPLKDVEVWLDRYRRFWDGTLESLSRHLQKKSKSQNKRRDR